MTFKSINVTFLLSYLATASAESQAKQSWNSADKQQMRDDWGDFGDCLGHDGSAGWLPIDYLQSDMQYVQEVREYIRRVRSTPFYQNQSLDTLPDSLSMDLYTRFYVNSLEPESDLVASEVHVDYSSEFINEVANLAPVGQEQDDMEDALDSVDHGYSFEGMFKPDHKVSMSGKSLQSMLFTEDGHFAGFTLAREDQAFDLYIVPTEFQGKVSELVMVPMSPRFLTHYSPSHTRLLGFRSAKRCQQDKQISSMMPIFYSVDQQMCKEVLQPLISSWYDEMPFFGNECHQTARLENQLVETISQKLNVKDPEPVAERNVFSNLTHIAVYLTWLELIIIFAIKCQQACLRTRRKRESRRAQLVRQESMPTEVDVDQIRRA